MLQKFTFALFVLFITHFAIAQDKMGGNANAKITGVIIDSLTHRPIEYATITLLNVENKKVITGATTGMKGTFTIANVLPGTYNLEAEFTISAFFNKPTIICPNPR